MMRSSNWISNNINPSILITVDYELFGNGEGDIHDHMIKPVEKLLAFLNNYDIPCTFFIETAEILAFQRAIDSGRADAPLKEAYHSTIEQIKEMVRLGHDIQLHYHPQWSEARYTHQGWELSSTHGSLLQYGAEQLRQDLCAGKNFLQSIGLPINPEYSCHIFRAGGFYYDRSETVGNLLLDLGIKADSSMVRGFYRKSETGVVDHRDLMRVNKAWWLSLDGSFDPTLDHGLYEIPLWSVYQPTWRKLKIARITTKFVRNRRGVNLKRIYNSAGAPNNFLKLPSWLLEKQANLWDFTLMSSGQLIGHFEEALSFHQPGDYLPLVMIGHSKELTSLKPLSAFIQYCNQKISPSWETMSEALRNIQLREGSFNAEV